MKLTMVVEIEDFDIYTPDWIESMVDKGREQGTVLSCILTDIPSEIDFVNGIL